MGLRDFFFLQPREELHAAIECADGGFPDMGIFLHPATAHVNLATPSFSSVGSLRLRAFCNPFLQFSNSDLDLSGSYGLKS